MNLSSPLSTLLRDPDASILTSLQRTTDGLTGRRLEEVSGSTSRSGFLRALVRLQSLGLVTRTDVGNSALYALNRRHLMWAGLQRILEAPAALEDAIAALVTGAFPRATVALYGSVARGDADLVSDVDVVVIDDDVDPVTRDLIADQLHDRVIELAGSFVHVVWLDTTQLRAMVGASDPLVTSWLEDSRTIAGVDLRRLLSQAATD